MSEEEKEKLPHAETAWFHFYKDFIRSGDMASLDCSTLRVYLVIKSYTNFSTGSAFPGIELIASDSRLSERQVIKCIGNLEKAGFISKNKSGRHNVYTLREKINIKDSDGNLQAIATWDYIPNGIKAAMAELKHVLLTGDLKSGKIIHIENFVMNISQGESIQMNVNAPNSKTPGVIKENIMAMKEILNK